MKTIIYVFISIVLISIVSALDECKGTIFDTDVPCLIFLPYNNDCTSVEMYVYSNGSTLLDFRYMYQYNPFTCNTTFNYSTYGTYTFNYSTGDTGSITVEEDVNNRYYLYVVALIAFLSLLGLGYWLEESMFVILSGMLSIVIAINLYVNGFPNLTNEFLKHSIIIVLTGIGFYFMIAPSLEDLKEWTRGLLKVD